MDSWFVIAILVLGLSIGFLGTERKSLALALVAVAGLLGLVAVRPVLAGVVAVPALYGFQDLGVGGGLGVSDALLVAAALLSLPALLHSQELARLTTLNRAFLMYLVMLVPSLATNPSAAADREVVHRIILVVGAGLVGAWLVKEGMEQSALQLLVLASVVLALACVLRAAQTGFAPAEPFGYNKNYSGSLIALTLLVVLCAPDHHIRRGWMRLLVVAILIAGVAACQSRGALLGAALGGLIWLFAPRHGTGIGGRNRVLALLLAASFTVYAGYSVEKQLTSKDANTNSAGVRLHVEALTRDLWRTSPLVGVGVRYYNTHNYGFFGIAPNNAFDAELAEGGLVGTVGFTGLHIAVLLALWRRRRSQLGTAALALVAGQFLHGQFDIYWASGVTPLPFLLAGMALAKEIKPRETAQLVSAL